MVPYMRAANVGWDGVKLEDVKEMDFTPKEQQIYRLRPGDIIVGEASGSKYEVGKSAVWRDEIPGACFQNTLIRVRLKDGLIPEYVQAHLKHDARRGALAEISKGVGIHHLSSKGLAAWTIGVPSVQEQHRIVNKLDALFERSRRAKTALDAVPPLLDKLRQSVLAAAFRGDLTADWRAKNPDVEPASKLLERIRVERRQRWEQAELEKMRAKGKEPKGDKWKEKYKEPVPVDTTGLPELPEGWVWASWAEVGFCQNGRAFPSKHYASQGTRLLRPGNLHVSGRVEWTTDNTRRMPDSWARKYADYVVGGNELLMNLTAQSLKDEFLGRVCITSPPELCLLNQRIARLTPVLLLPRFCLYWMKSPPFRSFVDSLNTGSLIQHMFTSQVYEHVMPIAPLQEQNELVGYIDRALDVVCRLAKLVEGQADALETLQRSVLGAAFRGDLVDRGSG
jgi:type I restriction enzyme S subunit